ncbi:hypothetical protein [Methylomonas sp. MK1]|uniref:hypothetical protein n=1 Tax=Methylomonas sp. MK1 TaxID=1131552 RepID=UPI000364DA1A|nr:hypothetical protein [Methylomonas sp. MK1]
MNTKTAKIDNQRAKLPKKLYIATDGSLKSCVTGPLLELPIDFQAWPQMDTSNIVLFVSKAA